MEHSFKDAAIIVADNGSTDGSVAFLEKEYPRIRVIRMDANLGFAGGYNAALRQIEADYYVLLNNDILVTPNWIPPLVTLMEQDKSIAACQPKILSLIEKHKFEYAGAAGGFIDSLGYPFCRGRIFQHIEDDTGQYDDACDVFWATGACLFVRGDLFHELGGFDDDFFAHMEEIDLCWRMKHLSYKVMYCPHSHVYHLGGGSLPKRSSFKTFLNIRNNIIMLYKNLPSRRRRRVLFVRFFMDILASIKFLIDGGVKDFLAVFRAYAAFYSKLKHHRKKRVAIPPEPVTGIYRGSIVFDHYLRRKKKFMQLNPNRL